MSAVLSQPPRPHVQQLPTELLLQIFRFATEVPSYLDPDVIIGPSYLTDKEQLRQSSLALVAKRYLVRASKEFYKIAIQLLYDHLVIARSKALSKIHATLTSSAALSSSQSRSLGSWTKRIDFVIRDTFKRNDSQFYTLIGLILSFLPNLRVLVINNTDRELELAKLPSGFLDPMPFKQSLEVIKVLCGDSMPTSWYGILSSSFPKLKALGDTSHNLSAYESPPKPLELPSLNSLFVSFTSPIMSISNLKFSHLRRLVLPVFGRWNSVVCSDSTSALLKQHGCHLEHVQLILQVVCPQSFDGLETSCLNLRRLDIILTSWINLPQSSSSSSPDIVLHLPPSIITLGFGCTTKQAAAMSYLQLIEIFDKMVVGDRFREIILLEPGNLTDFRDRHARIWNECCYRIQTRGFKFLGPDGESLHLVAA